jgi:peptide deformylase
MGLCIDDVFPTCPPAARASSDGVIAGAAGPNPCIDPFPLTAYIARMALRDILILPDKRLRLVSEPVKTIDGAVRRLVDDMFETMYKAPGIGLAAIQVGVPRRIITMDLSKEEDPQEPRVFINPDLLWSSEETATYEEGCLSIPEYYEEVTRPAEVRVQYLDLDGKEQVLEANGLLATCLQHEIDHLNGVLFIDYISKLKRDRVTKKYAKAAKRTEEGKA